MNYIVLDLEWNQSSEVNKEDRKLTFEIIEVGAVKLDSKRVIVGEFSSLVKPQVYHEMHKITSKLIHIQMQELEQGRPFTEVIEEFLSWCQEDYIFCTWGSLDLTEMQNNMVYFGMPALSDRPIVFLDVQKLFSLAFEDGKSRRTLEYAVDFLHMDKDIPFHRAFSDAYYTGKVLKQIPELLLQNVSFDLYNPPRNKESEVKIIFPTYAKYISRIFKDKNVALQDREVSSSKCYICHKNLKKKIRWFTPNGKHFYCVAYCDKHGLMKGKIRVHHVQDEEVYIVKTTRFITEEEADVIRERGNHTREIRKKRRQRK